MSNHTPGPWRWVGTGRDKDKLVAANGEDVLTPVMGWDKSNLGIRIGNWQWHWEMGTDPVEAERTSKANALLVAAAPEILAKLKDLITAFGPHVVEDQSCPSDARLIESAMALVARVES